MTSGGMQDYNYIWGSSMEITLELSCCKYPSRQELPRYWRENKNALLLYLGEVHRGVKGVLLDVNGNVVSKAILKIRGRDINFKSSKRGEFWRILMPGVYTIDVSADGYQNQSQQFKVEDNRITILNIQLLPNGFVSNTSILNTTLTNISIDKTLGLSPINQNNRSIDSKNQKTNKPATDKPMTKNKYRYKSVFQTTVFPNEVLRPENEIMFRLTSNEAIIKKINYFYITFGSLICFYLKNIFVL